MWVNPEIFGRIIQNGPRFGVMPKFIREHEGHVPIVSPHVTKFRHEDLTVKTASCR